MSDLIRATDRGLYCEAGDFYIDPRKGVERAVITHAHTDHARHGSQHYLCPRAGEHVLRLRLSGDARVSVLAWGEPTTYRGVTVSLHPAGHILGSAQVRVEHRGEVWVVSGDYKTEADGTCEPLEPLRCHTFITESTFALPVFRWRPQAEVFAEIHAWWRENQHAGRTSVIFAYALGKAQRLLFNLDASLGPLVVHPTITPFLRAYRDSGVKLPNVLRADPDVLKSIRGRGLVITPGSTSESRWLHKFGEVATAHASGWMQPGSPRRPRGVERGFVLSDHADWPGLHETIRATGATRIGVNHGYEAELARWAQLQGLDAWIVPARPGAAGADGAARARAFTPLLPGLLDPPRDPGAPAANTPQ